MKADKWLQIAQTVTWGIIVFMLCGMGIQWWKTAILIALVLILSAISQVRGVSSGMIRLVTNKREYGELRDTLFNTDTHKDKS